MRVLFFVLSPDRRRARSATDARQGRRPSKNHRSEVLPGPSRATQNRWKIAPGRSWGAPGDPRWILGASRRVPGASWGPPRTIWRRMWKLANFSNSQGRVPESILRSGRDPKIDEEWTGGQNIMVASTTGLPKTTEKALII